MSDHEAAAESRRRWGVEGRVWHPPGESKNGPSYCVVGQSNGRQFLHQFSPHGIGPTWEAAFHDADERER